MGSRYRTDREVALLLILNAISYGLEKKKDVIRYRIGMDALRAISDRSALRDAFLQEVADQLNKLGWCMATLPNGDGFAIFKAEIVGRWVGLGAKRLTSEGLLEMSETDLERYYAIQDQDPIE